MNARIVPISGGDAIPLIKDRILIGRRRDCDIRLDYPNVSGKHCELRYELGTWFVTDLQSTNGVRVNGSRVEMKKELYPGDELTIARKFGYRIEFELGKDFDPAKLAKTREEAIFSKPLLERAGLVPKRKAIEFDSDMFVEETEKTV